MAGIAVLIAALPLLGLTLIFPVSEWLSYRAARPHFDEHYAQVIIPRAVWVERFRGDHGRFPTSDEYHQSQGGYAEKCAVITTKPPWQKDWGEEGRAFMVGTGVGEWNLYYQSWDQKRWWEWNE